MFAKIESSFGTLKQYAVDMFKSATTRILVATTWLVLLFVGVAEPAQAATVQPQPAAAPNILCFFGAPSLGWADGIKPQTKVITGAGLGLVLLIAAVLLVVAGVRVLIAGRNADKAAEGFSQAKNVVSGVVLIFGGLIVLGVLITFIVSLVNFSSC